MANNVDPYMLHSGEDADAVAEIKSELHSAIEVDEEFINTEIKDEFIEDEEFLEGSQPENEIIINDSEESLDYGDVPADELPSSTTPKSRKQKEIDEKLTDGVIKKTGQYYYCTKCKVSKQFRSHMGVRMHIRVKHTDILNSTAKKDETIAKALRRSEWNKCRFECSVRYLTEKSIENKSLNKEPVINNSNIVGDHFVCTLCPNTNQYKYMVALYSHIKTMHMGKKYQCPECAGQYDEQIELNRHAKEEHALLLRYRTPNEHELLYESMYEKIGTVYVCTKCTERNKFHSQSTVMRHIKKTHIQYQCKICRVIRMSRTLLQKHLELKHNVAPECMEAKIVLNVGNYSQLKSIIKKEKTLSYDLSLKKIGLYYMCTVCTDFRKFVNKTMATQHIKLSHYCLKYKCIICDRKFLNGRWVRHHLKKKHKISSVNYYKNIEMFKGTVLHKPVAKAPAIKKSGIFYICPLCELPTKYKTISNVRWHIESSHYGQKYMCTKCEKNYVEKRVLLRHLIKCQNVDINDLHDLDKVEGILYIKVGDDDSDENNEAKKYDVIELVNGSSTRSSTRITRSSTRMTRSSTSNTGGSTSNTADRASNTGGSTSNTGDSTSNTGDSTSSTADSIGNTGESTSNTGASTSNTGDSTNSTADSIGNTGESTRNTGCSTSNTVNSIVGDTSDVIYISDDEHEEQEGNLIIDEHQGQEGQLRIDGDDSDKEHKQNNLANADLQINNIVTDDKEEVHHHVIDNHEDDNISTDDNEEGNLIIDDRAGDNLAIYKHEEESLIIDDHEEEKLFTDDHEEDNNNLVIDAIIVNEDSDVIILD